MGLATSIADLSDSPLPLGEAAQSIYEDVIKRQPKLARKDFSSVYQYLSRASEEEKKIRLGDLVSTDGTN